MPSRDSRGKPRPCTDPSFSLRSPWPCRPAPPKSAPRKSARRRGRRRRLPRARRPSVWKRLGGGTEAELCEAEALEAMGAFGSAARILTGLGENAKRALPLALRAAVLEDAARLWLADGRPDLARQGWPISRGCAAAAPTQLMLAARAEAGLGRWSAAAATLATADRGGAAERRGPCPARGRAAAGRRSGRRRGPRRTRRWRSRPTCPRRCSRRRRRRPSRATGRRPRRCWTQLIRAHPDHPLRDVGAAQSGRAVPSAAPEPSPPHPGQPGPRP